MIDPYERRMGWWTRVGKEVSRGSEIKGVLIDEPTAQAVIDAMNFHEWDGSQCERCELDPRRGEHGEGKCEFSEGVKAMMDYCQTCDLFGASSCTVHGPKKEVQP